jgi:Ca2+-binding RTX toxin-like protein
MVQDLSGSFYDDLPNVKTLLPTLMESLGAENDVAFGVGSFVDKPYETFGASGYDYVYKTDQAMSTDFAAVQASMDALRTYSGWDYPESQLEALVQTALRGAEIGFRDGAQKYVVLSTDATFHKEGDFDTHTDADGNVIDVADNDYDTDLELEDYPDMTAVGDLLQAAGITPIFAVTASVMPTYQALVDAWGFGSVVELDSDSANIVEAITAGITTTTVDLTLDVTGDDYGYVTGMTPEVYPDAGPGMYTFDITLEIPEDTSGLGSDGLSVSIPGYGTIDLDIAIAGMDLTGDDTANTLVGDDGNNIIDGLGGDDTLTGGLGNDTFVFADGSGNDRITDFQAGDLLDMRRMTTIATAADVLAAASQVGADTRIEFDTGDTITLEGVEVSSLTTENVLA